jgi:hypothetical protein
MFQKKKIKIVLSEVAWPVYWLAMKWMTRISFLSRIVFFSSLLHSCGSRFYVASSLLGTTGRFLGGKMATLLILDHEVRQRMHGPLLPLPQLS